MRRTLTGHDVISLSGGIDSPPIATFAEREYRRRWDRPIPALSAVYPSFPESDESRYIELVADELKLPLHTYEPGPQRLDRLQYWVELFDSPWSTWSPEGTAERCLHAQKLGARTILSGEFAEQASAIRAYSSPTSCGAGVGAGGGAAPFPACGANRSAPTCDAGRRRVHAAASSGSSLSSWAEPARPALDRHSADRRSRRRAAPFLPGGGGRRLSFRSSARIPPGRLTSIPTRSSASEPDDPGPTSTSGSSSSAFRSDQVP